MRILNYTPHTVTLVNENGTVDFPSDGIARVSSTESVVSTELGFPETVTEYGEVEGLPDPVDGTLIIVSRLVFSRCSNRDDLRVPGMQVRNDAGQVIGCKSLARN